MQLNIGTRQYRTKPKQFASINNDVIGNIVDLSLEEIIDRVGNKGYTFTRAIMRGARTKENFIKQRFLVLDFDEGMSEEKFKRRCTELRLSYVFMYRTLSWSKTEERGKSLFMNSLIDNEEKWKIAWSDNIPDKYPERCAYGKYPCPYSSTCNCYSLYAKASKKIRILESQEDFYDLEDCQKELKEYLQKGVSAANSEIYIIKAQTALGKTQQYIEIIKNNPNKKFIIAAPTIKLQLEIAARLMLEGVCCEITESMYAKAKQLNNPELTRLLDRAIAGGFERRIKKIIAKYKADHCEELSTREYDVVYVVTNEYEFADVFETMEEAEWYKQSKGTEAIQRVLDEWGIDDPTEEDIDNANIQAGIDGVCYEIEPVDISGMKEDDVIQLTNGAEVDMEEILKTLKANRNTWIDLIWLEIIDDFFVSLEDSYLFD